MSLSIQEQIIKPIKSSLEESARFTLGICGAPGAGKSTLAAWIVEEWNKLYPQESVLLPMDGYHYANEFLEERGLLALKGIPETFNADAFIKKLAEIRSNPQSTHYCPKFDRSIEASLENAIEISPEHRLVVVEGNYLLLGQEPWNQVKALLDQCWYIEADERLLLPRLQTRHEAGGKTEKDARAKVESTDLPNARLVAESMKRADRVLKAESLLGLITTEIPNSTRYGAVSPPDSH